MFGDEEKLAAALNKWTISSVETERILSGYGKGKTYKMTDLPMDSFVKIFSLVGSRSFNPQPAFHRYLKAGCNGKNQKEDDSYAVKNLMSLRRVCSAFDNAINNEMQPGIDYDWVDIGLKIKGFSDTRAVTFYKYGGTGSQHPATSLARIKRFNEIPYEHIEKFERITRLWLSDMVLNEELFDTLRRLDLKACEKIEFVKITDVHFATDVNVPIYIQTFLESINSPATVIFNSDVFDPNHVLFPKSTRRDDEASFGTEYLDAAIFELSASQNIHSLIRKEEERIHGTRIKRIRNHRTINLVNTVLTGNAHVEESGNDYADNKAKKLYVNNLYTTLENKTKHKERATKKAGKWHLKKVLGLLSEVPLKRKQEVFYHLKQLKKIAGGQPQLSGEEKAIIDARKEDIGLQQFLGKFPFLSRIPTVKRLYTEVKMEH